MKKIVLFFISGLLFSFSGLAQNNDAPGTLSMEVVRHLSFSVVETDVVFLLNQSSGLPPTNTSDYSNVTINATVPWIFEVTPKIPGATELVHENFPTSIIDAGLLSYYLTNVVGVVNVEYQAGVNEHIYPFIPSPVSPPKGTLNATFRINWVLDNSTINVGTLYAGDYNMSIEYTLVEGQ